MRTTKESHPQMREVTIPLLAQFQSSIPLLYDDIAPNSRQIENMRKPR
jgi:thymidylate synthase ThyX